MQREAWRLILAKGLLDNYLGGEDVWTFRKYVPGSHELKKGQIIKGHFQGSVMLLLEVMEDTRIKRFADITEEECMEWGNCSHAEMMQRLRISYPAGLLENDTAALIKTRLARINNRPIAGFLPNGI